MASIPWKALAIGGAVVGTLGIGAVALAHRRSTLQPRRVALIGDSYAVGLGPELKRLLDPFESEGHVGTNTGQWAAHSAACGRCGDWLKNFQPTLVLVSLGVNDGAAPQLSSYQTIVRGIHGIGARVLWVEPPAGVQAPEVRAAIASLGVPTVPATNAPLAADGLHPTGYQDWAREIAGVVGRG